MLFSFSVVCSNDVGIDKLNPLTVRIFEDMRREVTTQLFDMCRQLVVIVELLHLFKWMLCYEIVKYHGQVVLVLALIMLL